MHLDPQGYMRAQYGLRLSENNKLASAVPTAQFMRSSASGKSVYWIVQGLDG